MRKRVLPGLVLPFGVVVAAVFIHTARRFYEFSGVHPVKRRHFDGEASSVSDLTPRSYEQLKLSLWETFGEIPSLPPVRGAHRRAALRSSQWRHLPVPVNPRPSLRSHAHPWP